MKVYAMNFWEYLQAAGFTESEATIMTEGDLRILIDMYFTDVLGM